MSDGPFSVALAPLAARMPRIVRDREILRVAGILMGASASDCAAKARQQVLRWAERRSGGRLPRDAWAQESFEFLAGGRTSIGIRFQEEDIDLWALRAEDPDKTVAQRHWTTEVVVGLYGAQPPRFSLRLLASSPEESLNITPAVPGLIQQIVNQCGLLVENKNISSGPLHFETAEDSEHLCDLLESPLRQIPMFVASISDREATPLIDLNSLARATLGIATVASLSSEASWTLTERFGKKLSVFGGAVRVYMPGFGPDADPYTGHRLILRDQLELSTAAQDCETWLRRLAAESSLRRLRLGRDVVTFAKIRDARLHAQSRYLQAQSIHLREVGADQASQLRAVEEQLDSAEERIENLQEQLKSAASDQQWLSDEHAAAEERAKHLEKQLQRANYRIAQLTAQLKDRGEAPDTNIELPTDWSSFSDWCENNLAGRVLLSQRARRECRSPMYQDVATAARCLLWLANTYRDSRRDGASGDLRGPVQAGILNDRCGADSFPFDWSGSRHIVEWHIKNGGNTRDPSRCLRIYYFWDESIEQVIIASMPEHLTTGAS